MTATAGLLDSVLRQLHPGDDVISAARARRDEVLRVAGGFEGALRTYWSGSIAHRTANFDTDADGGIVLDRREYPKLGPDGDGVSPTQVVDDVRAWLREELKADHPEIRFLVTKRAIKITYHEPVGDGPHADPSVDLIVGLTRRDAPGLWIPNLSAKRWSPSHPERHTALLTAEPKALRQKRSKVIRLAKGWNQQFSERAVCSFNIEALALEFVESGTSLSETLAILFELSAADLARRDTPDPAGVSPPIKTLIDRQQASERFRRAGEQLRDALDHDDDECEARAALSKLFKDFVDPCPADADLRVALQAGGQRFTTSGFLATVPTVSRQRTTRSYGGELESGR